MAKGFTFERDLPHQIKGVSSVMDVFAGASIIHSTNVLNKLLMNPELSISDSDYKQNINAIQNYNEIAHSKDYFDGSRVIDVSMETGTGKTYTYTKTLFELNKVFGVTKFVIAVPTLSIKAGTVNFLKSEAAKEHFRDDYDGREIKVHVVESQKGKNKKQYIPQAIHDFVEATNSNQKYLHVLVINSGMINSDSIKDSYDTGLFGGDCDTPIKAIQAVKPIMIIDEPHRFPTAKKTWDNLLNFQSQYIIRYGATFNDDYKNLVYRLTALDAFNDDLVKGISAHIEEVVGDDKCTVTFISSTGSEATFELNEGNNKTTFKLMKGDDLSLVHHAIHDLKISALNQTTVALSNGVELKKGKKKQDKIKPYSYDKNLEDNMMQKAIKSHFKIERELLTQTPRIKPLSLFFIDDIDGYRNGNELSGSLKEKFESWVRAEAKERLESEIDPFYKAYLEKTISDLSLVHGGYFSKDNSDKDEKIEKEINDILHDKESLLSLNNPRRFIFSKWTLREGWDNPNVFQICKLRSSGSTTSKLQEVGRGLRLPVNEHMSRVKDRPFTLHYFVDFSESDFVESLVKEVNEKSFKETIPSKLTQEIKDNIIKRYPTVTPLGLLIELNKEGIIDEHEQFINERSYFELKESYPNAFPKRLKEGKITSNKGNQPKTVKMRQGRFDELKSLWELVNQKAILNYKVKDEAAFLALFVAYLKGQKDTFKQAGAQTRIEKMVTVNDVMMSKRQYSLDDGFTPFNTMSYQEFVTQLSQKAWIKPTTLHHAFVAVMGLIDINQYLNPQTIRKIQSGFNQFLLHNSFNQFELGYKVVSNSCHPTKFTTESGSPRESITASDLGVHSDPDGVAVNSYLFDEVFFDSELERINITDGEIESVTVFTKIPKNSIKIPVSGGSSYSPDFAYVVKTAQGETLNFIIETKNVESGEVLRKDEAQKIAHAKTLFNQISNDVKVDFKTQFSNDKIVDLIKQSIIESS